MSIGCCWPLWGNKGKPTHLYCGQERQPGAVYCPKHYARAYVGRVAQRQVADIVPNYSRSAYSKPANA
jgi:hypothetical protein